MPYLDSVKKLAVDRSYRLKNKERIRAQRREYYLRNRERLLSRARHYSKSHPEVRRARRKIRALDPTFRMVVSFRARLYKAVKRKTTGSFELLGCSAEALKIHLESLFSPGMSWENYGDWHIDHRRPCASFDLSDPEQQKACFHFSNLQPLWKEDNLRKGAKT
jgi:hypothetical protein